MSLHLPPLPWLVLPVRTHSLFLVSLSAGYTIPSIPAEPRLEKADEISTPSQPTSLLCPLSTCTSKAHRLLRTGLKLGDPADWPWWGHWFSKGRDGNNTQWPSGRSRTELRSPSPTIWPWLLLGWNHFSIPAIHPGLCGYFLELHSVFLPIPVPSGYVISLGRDGWRWLSQSSNA